jgi:hypothetical protein
MQTQFVRHVCHLIRLENGLLLYAQRAFFVLIKLHSGPQIPCLLEFTLKDLHDAMCVCVADRTLGNEPESDTVDSLMNGACFAWCPHQNELP